MTKNTSLFSRVLVCLVAAGLVGACDDGPTSVPGEYLSGSPSSPAPAEVRVAAPTRLPWSTPLTPEGSGELLAQLERGPCEAEALASGAAFYAQSEASGMVLIWGLSYAACEPGGPRQPELAALMAGVLRDHVHVTMRDGERQVATNLAPGEAGELPGLEAEGGTWLIPAAHMFEIMFSMSIAYGEPEPSLFGLTVTYENYLFVTSKLGGSGIPLDEWLRSLHTAGHLEGFVVASYGDAFPEELADYITDHPGAIEAAVDYVRVHPFAPAQATLPDTLVPFHAAR